MATAGVHEQPTVLALGSPHGDDRAAWCVIDLLQQDDSFSGRCVRVTSPWDIVPHLPTSSEVLIVDACRSGAAPGTVHRLTARDLPNLSSVGASTHGGSLPEALELGRTLGYDVAHVTVYAIELATAAAGAPLSPAVESAVEQVACRIRNRSAPEPRASECRTHGN